MKKTLFGLIYGTFLLSNLVGTAQAVDAKKGQVAFETCRGCHSTPNYSNVYPTYYVPKIGGQRPEYTVAALTAYKDNKRPKSAMTANSFDLTPHAMESIAAYMDDAAAPKDFAPASGDPVEGKKLAATCEGCHTNDLKDGATAPILAGQYGNYLVKVMKDYQSGKRKNPIMQSMLADLSKENLEDISAYFAKMKGLSIIK